MECITQEILDAARNAGACAEGLCYPIGTPLSKVKSSHLAWLEEHCSELADSLAEKCSMSIGATGIISLRYFGYGDGYGDGCAYGDGDACGYGDGYGDGCAHGDGCGYAIDMVLT